jgi:hypothetical protein
MTAAINMLESAIRTCPDALWHECMWDVGTDQPELSQVWYVSSHVTFFLDLYLTGELEGFAPPAPFTLDELDPAGVIPAHRYTRDEILIYVNYIRAKCDRMLLDLSDAQAQRMCKFGWLELNYAELQLDNLRHVQEHTAQINMFLGQRLSQPAKWIGMVKSR